MKNLWNILLTAAVAILGFLYVKDHSTASTPATAAGTLTKKVVYVNTDTLLKHYDYYTVVTKEMESKRFRLENELANKGKALQNEAVSFQEKIQKGAITEEQARSIQAQLGKKEQDIYAYRDNSMKALAIEEAKKTDELLTKIQDYLKRHSKVANYEMAMGYSKGGGVLYANEGLDITKEVLAALNKEYAESTKK